MVTDTDITLDQRSRLVRGVTPKAVIVGLILIPLNCYWIMNVEGVWHTGHPTCISLFWNCIFCITVLILINLLLKRFLPFVAFSQGELITIYAMLCIASGLAGHDCMQLLVPALSRPFELATPENNWEELFCHRLPRWLTVRDPEVRTAYYGGGGTAVLYTEHHLKVWLTPVLWWSVFIAMLALVMICINVLMRKEWTEREKLSYPIIRLPMSLTEEGGTGRFWTNRMLWVGIAIGLGLDVLNGLNVFIPEIPPLMVRHNQRSLHALFSPELRRVLGSMPLPFYPFIISLGFFLPVDLSFSIWFFYLFRKAQQYFGHAVGLQLPGYPFTSEQSWGAWLALSGFAIWIAREHLRDVAARIIGRPGLRLLAQLAPTEGLRDRLTRAAERPLLDDRDEPMRYRTAALGIVVGGVFLYTFCIFAGMRWWVIIIFFGLFYLLSIAITRMRAELGPPAHEMAFMMNSAGFLIPTVGTSKLGTGNLTMFPMFWFFTGRGYRSHIMPHQLEAFKMSEQAKSNPRKLGVVMAVAAFLGALASFWALIHLTYALGRIRGDAIDHTGQFWSLQYWLTSPKLKAPDPTRIGFMGGGMLFTLLLMFLRTRIPGWPLHPAGYALSMNFGVEYFWSCLVIATCIKYVVLRYFGLAQYRKILPLFFGIIIGEYFMGSFWSVWSVIFQIRTYDFAPG